MENISYLNTLNDKQKEAVLYQGKSLLILAGAGSGKTRVITTKIAYALDVLGYEPRDILAVTFTNKAAREMRERVDALLGYESDIHIKTFHSFGAWFLRQEARRAGLNRYFSIYDDEDSISLLNTLELNKKRRDLSQYAHWISRAKDYNLKYSDDLSLVSSDAEFAAIYEMYQEKLNTIGNFDFGDLICKPIELLKNDPLTQRFYQNRFKLILVDEYQDSNVAQYELLRALTGSESSICVVGDDDQSIYKFRGAEIQNILNFHNQFEDVHTIRLEENYRSTGNILAIASHVVANNDSRLGKTLWTKKDEGEKAKLAVLSSQEDEARYCAELLQDGNLAGTAILYRTNAQSVAFEQFFTEHRIPYRLVGATRFYDREEIKDVMAFLSLLLNKNDEIAFRRIINKPARGIGKKSIEHIVHLGQTQFEGDLLQALHASDQVLSGKAVKSAAKQGRLFEKLREELPGLKLIEVIQRVLDNFDLLSHYTDIDKKNGSQKVANLDALINLSAKYSVGEEALSQFLEQVELDQSLTEETQKNSQDSVTLITVHNTKGLEFDRVIVTGLEENLFPSRSDNLEDIEEERRLFYVAITRAKKELHFTYCRRRRIWGKMTEQSPSIFINELPMDYIDSGQKGSVESGGYPRGTAVYHDDYGSGVVVKEWQNGQSWVVLVQFESGRNAQFIPQYSQLEKIAASDA